MNDNKPNLGDAKKLLHELLLYHHEKMLGIAEARAPSWPPKGIDHDPEFNMHQKAHAELWMIAKASPFGQQLEREYREEKAWRYARAYGMFNRGSGL